MKKIINLLLAMLSFITFTHAQNFKGHISTTLGIINPKYRIQCEVPITNYISSGVNMNYYLFFWKGPIFEPFVRLYDGNDKGQFIQAKLMYGNLSSYSEPNVSNELLDGKRWSTYGFGIGYGYKYLLGKHFTIEPLTGLRFLSRPPKSAMGDNPLLWQISTGLMWDLQIKFGLQF
jgi:hypothetical protein